MLLALWYIYFEQVVEITEGDVAIYYRRRRR
jgi:hypothetical protein